MRAVYLAVYEFLLTVPAAAEETQRYQACADLLAESLRKDLVADGRAQRAWWRTEDPLREDAPAEEYFQQYWAYFALRLIHAVNPQALPAAGFAISPAQPGSE